MAKDDNKNKKRKSDQNSEEGLAALFAMIEKASEDRPPEQPPAEPPEIDEEAPKDDKNPDEGAELAPEPEAEPNPETEAKPKTESETEQRLPTESGADQNTGCAKIISRPGETPPPLPPNKKSKSNQKADKPKPPTPSDKTDFKGTPGTYPYTNAGHYYYVQDINKKRDYGRRLPDATFQQLLGINPDPIGKARLCGLDYKEWFHIPGSQNFKLKTVYPGMLLGVGYMHPAEIDGDFQSGFFFDWTTGLPVIPGSTVKGLLRSVFPREPDKQSQKEPDEIKKQEAINKNKAAYILDCLKEVKSPGTPVKFTKALKKALFVERGLIFYDAYIAGLGKDSLIFAEDYITPHKDNPFGDPTPLRFLKIAPGVAFCFQFILKSVPVEIKVNDKTKKVEIPADAIQSLFKTILTDFGAGAKRNTGYGVLEECA